MSAKTVNVEAWSRNAIAFIRARGLEGEFSDWCGGWPVPSEERLGASAAGPEGAELGLKTNQSLTPLEEELVEALKEVEQALQYAFRRTRDQEDADHFERVRDIARSALSKAESRQPEPRPDSKALPVGRGER